MQQYIEWLQTCLNNINAGVDIQTYGQALYWQGMLLVSLLVPILFVVIWVLIPMVFIRKSFHKYKNIPIDAENDFCKIKVPKQILLNLSKTIKKVRAGIILYVAVTLYLIMPILMQSKVALFIIVIITLGFIICDLVISAFNYDAAFIEDEEYKDVLHKKYLSMLGYASLQFVKKNNPRLDIPYHFIGY